MRSAKNWRVVPFVGLALAVASIGGCDAAIDDDGGPADGGGAAGAEGGAGTSGPSGGAGRGGRGGSSSSGMAGRSGQPAGSGDGGAADAAVGSDASNGSSGRSGGSAGAAGDDEGSAGTRGPDVEDPGQPAGTVPVFVAVGSGYRTAVSYDQGATWMHDQPLDSGGIDCFNTDCSHGPGTSLGIAYGNGWFVVEFGNISQDGKTPTVHRSQDGYSWEKVLDIQMDGVTFGNGRFVGGGNPSHYSDDNGATWKRGTPYETRMDTFNVRRAAFVPYDGGRFLIGLAAGGAKFDLVISTDGIEFRSAATLPAECNMGNFAYGDGVLIGSGSGGRVCRSLDGGDNWTAVNINGSDIRSVTWDGEVFIAYHYDLGYTSPDGLTWTQIKVTPGDSHVGRIARWGAGEDGGFLTWGETKKDLMRSPDGRTWTLVNVAKTQPLGHFVFGYAKE